MSTTTDEPTFPPPSDREREASSWWFRQITTTFMLANAGGVLTVSGFAGNTENISVATLIAFPAVSYFVAGAVFASPVFFLQFLYSSLRLEALAEHDKKRNEWRNERGLNSTYNVPATAGFLLIVALMLGLLAGSGTYFYKGARQASLGTSAVYCATIDAKDGCTTQVFLFGKVPERLLDQAKRAVRLPDKPETLTDTAPKPLPTLESRAKEEFILRATAEHVLATWQECKQVVFTEWAAGSSGTVAVYCSGPSGLFLIETAIPQIEALAPPSNR